MTISQLPWRIGRILQGVHLLVLLLLLPLAQFLVTAQNVTFRRDTAACPPSSGVPSDKQLLGVSSEQTCSVECALRSDCAVYNFAPAASSCQMGSTVDLLTNWQAANTNQSCHSQVNSGLPAALTFRSKLLAYLDFRLGQSNLVDPANRFGVASVSTGVTFNASGANFPPIDTAGPANYVELNTTVGSGGGESFADLLGRGRNFSVYARVRRLANRNQTLFMTYDCGSHTEVRGALIYFKNRVSMCHSLEGPTQLDFYRSSQSFNDASDPFVASSVGAVFSHSNFTAAYYNGQLTPVEPLALPGISYTGPPECLRLGYSSLDVNESLVGSFVCFALASEALTLEEFAELDALCG